MRVKIKGAQRKTTAKETNKEKTILSLRVSECQQK